VPANEHNMDIYELLMHNQIFFITDDVDVEKYAKVLEAPKCKDLFMTFIDGMNMRPFQLS
jgi:hypothetical protein